MRTVDIANELDLHARMRDAIERGAGAVVLAEEAGCTASTVYAVYEGQRAMTDGIARALGYSRVSGWQRSDDGANGRVFDATLKPRRGRPPRLGRALEIAMKKGIVK